MSFKLSFPSLCFASGLKRAGHRLHSDMFFDTLKVNCSVAAKDILERAMQRQINLRVYSEGVVSARMFFFFFFESIEEMMFSRKNCCLVTEGERS